MFNFLSHQRNVNQNNSEIPSEWLRLKTLMIAYAAEDVEQWKHLSIAGGNVNLCNSFGNQCGGFSEN